MRTLFALLISILCCFSQSTMDFSAGPGQRDVRDITGSPVVVGTASIGFFEEETWHEYGVTDIKEIFGQPGRFGGRATSTDPLFIGQQIFLKIESEKTGGLYTSGLDNWVFPDPNAIFPNNTGSINSSEVDEAIFGFYNTSHLILAPEPRFIHIAIVCGIMALILFLVRGRRP